MLGLKRGTVALCPHEETWEREAARTIQTLWAILGDAAAEWARLGKPMPTTD